MIIKTQKWGNSVGIRLPSQLLKECNLSLGVEFTAKIIDDGIFLSPAKPKEKTLTLADLLVGAVPEEELDWGPDVGNEIVIW